MSDHEIGTQVAYQKMRENVLDWAEDSGDVELEEYLSILMNSTDSDTGRFHNLQMIGLELGYQGGEEAPADDLYEKILEADTENDSQVFGLSPERAERAFYDMGYESAIHTEKHRKD